MKKSVVFLGGLLFIFLYMSGCSLSNNGNIVSEPPTKNTKNSKRIALVIGNGAYKIEPLTNPANDAHDMATVLLREVGFEVTLEVNANKARMEKAIQAFQDKLLEGGVGLFYYSGHAVQYESENYIIPVGAMETIYTIDKSKKKQSKRLKHK
jgi:hypothetical protein